MADWADLRRQARRDVHSAFAVQAFYRDSVVTVEVGLTVRWHDRFVAEPGATGFASVFDSIDHVILSAEELAAESLSPKRGGIIRFPDYGNSEVVLDTRLPIDGPINVPWTVTRPEKIAPYV